MAFWMANLSKVVENVSKFANVDILMSMKVYMIVIVGRGCRGLVCNLLIDIFAAIKHQNFWIVANFLGQVLFNPSSTVLPFHRAIKLRYYIGLRTHKHPLIIL